MCLLMYWDNFMQFQISKSFRYTLAYSFLCLADICTYPFQMMESRFVLQNWKPTYRTYSYNYFWTNMFKMRLKTFYNGVNGIFYLNLTNLLRYKLIVSDVSGVSFANWSVFVALLSYPVTTVMRRLQCQSNDIGMIPARYEGVTHALKLVYNEEGFKGLYRGFLANTTAQIIGLSMVKVIMSFRDSAKNNK